MDNVPGTDYSLAHEDNNLGNVPCDVGNTHLQPSVSVAESWRRHVGCKSCRGLRRHLAGARSDGDQLPWHLVEIQAI